jgi:Protein of unknown function (DUF935)
MSILTRIADAASAGLDAAFDAWSGAPTAGAAPPPDSAATRGASEHLRVLAHPPPASERDPAVLGNRLTPALLAALIAQRNRGWMQPWVDLGGEFLQKNPHLVAQLSIRRDSVVETRFEARPGRGSNQRAARKAADACGELLCAWQARPEHAWADLVAGITAAVWWQRSVHEVMWVRDGRELRVDRLVAVHPRRLSLAAPHGDPEASALRLHDPDDPDSPFSGPYGTPLTRFHPDKFLVHTTSPLGLQPTCDGLFAAAVWYLLMYEWSWRDLMALIELIGRPAHLGYYAAGGAKAAHPLPGVAKLDGVRFATDAEIEKLRRVVTGVSGSLRDVLADTTRVEPLRYDRDVTPVQREALEHLERLLSKLVNGADSISDLRPGARAAQQVLYAQSLTFWRADVRRVCSAITWLFGRYVAANPGIFPEGTPTPELWSPDLETPRGSLADVG